MSSRLPITAHLLRWRACGTPQRTESTPRGAAALAASHLDPSRQPATLIRIGLTALLLAATAGPAAAQESTRHGGELVFVVPAEPPSYDAHREETFAIVHPAAPHYNTLPRVDPTDRTGTRIVGDLGESWTVSADGRTYT